MPRPRTVHDDAVLDAALRVVDRVGPGGLTLAAVAAEAGLAAPTLVQRFGTKRGLLLAVARRGAGDAGASLREARRRHRSPLRALAGGLVRMASPVSSPEVLANHLAFLQMDLADPDFHALARAHATAVRVEIEGLLEAAVAAGELGPHDTRRLARAVHVTYNGALVTWAVDREGRLDRFLRRELEILLERFGAR